MPRSESPIPETVLDRLRSTSSGLEIWWDSSPLIYPGWSQKLIAGFPEGKRATLGDQLRRLYDPSHPAETLFTGVTTNPPLSYQAIQDDPARWSAWARAVSQKTTPAPTMQNPSQTAGLASTSPANRT